MAEKKPATKGKPKKADKADGEATLMTKIAEMAEPDRGICERLHAVITASGPGLVPRLWYGMPAYARDGKVIVFFRDTQKFKERYLTLGFNEDANLDDGTMWPVAFALKKLTADDEAKIARLVKKAVS